MHESHREALPRMCAEAGLVAAEVRRDLAGLPRLVVARAKE
jgi:release factor glutamine methyltransferase